MEETPAAVTTPETPRERRLAAVVFTDVVGYSAMMNADEGTTITRVGADLDRMQAQCVASGGECLNTMGDGLMLAFPSTVQAMTFATQMQEEFARRNEVEGAVPLLQHRIGIHLGDVVRMPDGALAGDGVNIAARLESSAPPGGICISQTVYDTVRGKLAFDATFAGPKTFKNIAQPIPVWHLHPRGLVPAAPIVLPAAASRALLRRTLIGGVAGAAAIDGARAYWFRRNGSGATAVTGPDPRSIAVLPFANMSDDKDTSYFADGMHEDLLTQLALVSQLKVVSRTSVMEYRNTAKKIPQIGAELKVASLVEGSVRRAGNVVRVTAQLLDANSDKHIWAANYDRDMKDIFKVQSELASEIAKSLNVSLSAAEEKRLTRAPTENLQAYDLFLQYQERARSTEGSMRHFPSALDRIALLKQVVALDPTFALAWAKLASEQGIARYWGLDQDDSRKAAAVQAIAKAVALAPEDLQVRSEEADVKLHALNDQAGARIAYQQVLVKAPYFVPALIGLGEVLGQLGLNAEAAPVLEQALSVDSRNATVLTRLANTYGPFRHFDRALVLRKQVVDMRPADLDVRAGYEWWIYRKNGSWASFDAWRATLPKDIEKRVARVRNIDGGCAIARWDFGEHHRLLDVDSEDFRQSLTVSAMNEVDIGFSHALAWNAAGEKARAAKAAAEIIRRAESAIKGTGNSDDIFLWHAKANMHALLGQREPAHAALDRSVALAEQTGNLDFAELQRRNVTGVLALLGEHEQAIATLKRYSRLPRFLIHDQRLDLKHAPLWKHADFIALVNDPAANAPLPLDTPLSDNPRR
jgi:adenylate cyclase